MTNTWNIEYGIACIAHGEEAATTQMLHKYDATIEEASYVLYDDTDLIKAVLADPNWAGRLMKAPPTGQAQFGMDETSGAPIMSTTQGTIPAPDFTQQKTGLAALNPLIDQPSEAHRRAMTNWFGADKMREQGLQPKEGLMNRFSNMMEARRNRQAQLRQVPGYWETRSQEGKQGLRRRAAVRDAIRGNQTEAGLAARERGAPVNEEGGYDEDYGLPAEEEEEPPAEEESDLGPAVAEISDDSPPGDVVAPVESPAAGPAPWWARQPGEAGYRKTSPRAGIGMHGMGARNIGKLGELGGPTEGESIEGWKTRTGASDNLVSRLRAHLEGGAQHGDSRLFGSEGLGGEGEGRGWAHPFGPSAAAGGEAIPDGTFGDESELPSDEDMEDALKPEEVGADQPLPDMTAIEGAGSDASNWGEEDWSQHLDTMGDEVKEIGDGGTDFGVPGESEVFDPSGESEAVEKPKTEKPKKEKPIEFQLSEDNEEAKSMAWNHLTFLKQNWDYTIRQYE